MPETEIDDEILMAYADGELGEAEARRVEHRVAGDRELARRLELFVETRAQAKLAYEHIAGDEMSGEIEAKVRQMIAASKPSGQAGGPAGNVVPFMRRLARIPPVRPQVGMGLAAAISALAILAGGYLAGRYTAPELEAGFPSLALGAVGSPELMRALTDVPSGRDYALAGTDARMRVVLSFRDGSGTLCREFEVTRDAGPKLIAVACRPHNVWQVGFAMASGPGTDGFAPASSAETLDAYMHSILAGDPLTAKEERAALRAGQ